MKYVNKINWNEFEQSIRSPAKIGKKARDSKLSHGLLFTPHVNARRICPEPPAPHPRGLHGLSILHVYRVF